MSIKRPPVAASKVGAAPKGIGKTLVTCPDCGKEFTTARTLATHTKLVHQAAEFPNMEAVKKAEPKKRLKRRITKGSEKMATSTRSKTPAKRRTAQPKHPLAHLIPSSFFIDDYIGRDVAGVEDKTILAVARQEMLNTLIFGPTGPGKTSLVYAYAAEAGLPLYSVSCNGAVEPSELFGRWVPTSTPGRLEWQDGPVTMLVRHGGILYLDEVNMMPPRIAAVLHSVLDKRRSITLMDHGGEFLIAHDDFQVVATYNPGYEDTRPMNKAFRNRFALKLEWDYDPNVEKELVDSTVLRELAKALRDRKDDIETPVTTNMLQELEIFAQNEVLGPEFAIKNFLNSFSEDERPGVQVSIEAYGERLTDEISGWEFVDDDGNDVPVENATKESK